MKAMTNAGRRRIPVHEMHVGSTGRLRPQHHLTHLGVAEHRSGSNSDGGSRGASLCLKRERGEGETDSESE